MEEEEEALPYTVTHLHTVRIDDGVVLASGRPKTSLV
jgi:hypothetical protein